MRIRRSSLNKKIFFESKMYIEAFENCGFKEVFTYLEPKKIKPNNNNNNNNNNLYKDKETTTDNCNIKVNCHKNRKRKIIWFNPPFCKLVNINVGNFFFKHFNQFNKLHKIFNWKTLKISYSCMNFFFFR